MAKDLYHDLVKEILVKDGWTITDDPYYVKWNPEWQIDLGAEKIIGATKENEQIAVEIKSFLKASFSNEFHSILGQYLNYLSALKRTDPSRKLYLAVPEFVWNTKFQIEGIKVSIEDYDVKIFVYNIQTKKIKRWII
ncbi:MAG: element excision factor XisH family protein [Saprospiraceae bacterium]